MTVPPASPALLYWWAVLLGPDQRNRTHEKKKVMSSLTQTRHDLSFLIQKWTGFMSHHLLLLKFYHKYLDLYGPICPESKTDFLFCLWAWLCLVGVVVTVVVAVSDGRGACRWFWIVFFSEIYYFIVWDILFYCDIYIILLHW